MFHKQTPAEMIATAYHESGHAVVNIVQGISLHQLCIITDPNSPYGGHCFPIMPEQIFKEGTPEQHEELAEKILVSTFAGVHAQRLVDDNPVYDAGDYDEVFANHLIRQYGVGLRVYEEHGSDKFFQFRTSLDDKSRQLVHEYKSLIAAVAKRLLKVETMNNDQVTEVMKQEGWSPQ